MWLFVAFPLSILVCIDVGAVAWWIRRRALMNNGVPVTGEVVRINITETRRGNSRTGISSSDITVRPVVRFTARTGEPITTSPMRSGVDKLLVPGDPVKIRYSATNPTHCILDQRGAYQGAAGVVAGLVVANIFLIGFIIFAAQGIRAAQTSGLM